MVLNKFGIWNCDWTEFIWILYYIYEPIVDIRVWNIKPIVDIRYTIKLICKVYNPKYYYSNFNPMEHKD